MTRHDRQATQGSAAGVDARLARDGALSYLEIPAVDARRSAAFYEAVLGWNVIGGGGDDDEAKFLDQSGHLLGRWVTGRAASREPGLLPFIYVDGIDDVVARVVTPGRDRESTLPRRQPARRDDPRPRRQSHRTVAESDVVDGHSSIDA